MIKLPFNNKPTTVVLIVVFLILMLLGISTSCRGAEVKGSAYVLAEAGAAVVRAEVPAIRLGVVWPRVVRDADIECGLSLLSANTYRGVDNRNQAFVDCMVVDGIGRFDFGVGPSFAQNVDNITGSHFNFSLLFRVNFARHWFCGWHHKSNAGTTDVNAGRDYVACGRKFR